MSDSGSGSGGGSGGSFNGMMGGIGTLAIQSTIITNIMNSKLKTGHPLLDILVAVLISSLFTMIFGTVPQILSVLYENIKKNTVYIASQINGVKHMTIKHVEMLNLKSGVRYNNGKNDYDYHLVLALELYIQRNQSSLNPKTLVGNLSTKTANTKNDYVYMKTCKFKFSNSDQMIKLDNGITLNIDHSEQKNEKIICTTRSITLSTKKTYTFLNDFLKQVYDEYVESEYKQYDSEDESRYFLTLKSDSDEKTDHKWKRYNLNVERTFDSIFFPDKSTILSALDDFTNKRGIYEKKCTPYKFSILLHGPPGTGKTSFLKALSNYTERHIINVSLPLIETNEKLIEVFQSTRIKVHVDNDYVRGEEIPMNKRIYVLEDVDVLSDIVKNRDVDLEDSSDDYFSESDNDNDNDNDSDNDNDNDNDSDNDSDNHNKNNKDSLKKKQKKTKKATIEQKKKIRNVKQYIKPTIKGSGKKTKKYGPLSSHSYGNAYERYCIQNDKLNLSGLLNALDGLLELHGVIIVLTTNHPDKLDPAIIRPGRITYKLEMTFMKQNEIINMIQFHYPEINDKELEKISSLCFEKVTPATIENICLQSKDVETLIHLLKNISNSK